MSSVTLANASYEGPAGTVGRQQYHATVTVEKGAPRLLVSSIGALTLSHGVEMIGCNVYTGHTFQGDGQTQEDALRVAVSKLQRAAKRRGLTLK